MEGFMRRAIEEARRSLRLGDQGFGAVIVRGGEVVATAQDTIITGRDPTAHAGLRAIGTAARRLGGDLSGCLLVATHEPCPMCAGAALWAGIGEVAYGVSIGEGLVQCRSRISLSCQEVFAYANAPVRIHPGVLGKEAAVLYRADVRRQVDALRGIDDPGLAALCADSKHRRLAWFASLTKQQALPKGPPLEAGYLLLLLRLGIGPEEAPVVARSETSLTFRSCNFCPTLEACKILGLDPRWVCKRLNEASTDLLLKQLNPRLRFSRNYERLRPHAPFCEETLHLGPP